jgi:hypothetical protein
MTAMLLFWVLLVAAAVTGVYAYQWLARCSARHVAALDGARQGAEYDDLDALSARDVESLIAGATAATREAAR